jgi:hypothetical protein
MDRHAIMADVGAIGAILGSLAGYLPPMAALIGILWYAIQIWESDTVQRLRSRRWVDRAAEQIEQSQDHPRVLDLSKDS